MTPTSHAEVRRGQYYDSVTLMRASRDLAEVAGVHAAQVAMATPLNLEVLQGMGLTPPPGAGPNDLVVVLSADGEEAVQAALTRLDAVLSARPGGSARTGEDEPPHTVGSALGRDGLSGALVVVSVPGSAAYAEALDAVEAGSSVMIFSDNVPLAQEIALKARAGEVGVLVMGPDCGTAVVGGVGLGFANVVRPGPVSLVAASGTGAQQMLALLDAASIGVRHCLGLGGRDLSAAVGGRSARQALAALDADEGTELIVVVSKPPDPQVLQSLQTLAADLATPVMWAPLGAGRDDLTAVAEHVAARLGAEVPPRWPEWVPDRALSWRPGHALRGLFCGGTLCDEAMVVASSVLGDVHSNIPLRPEWALAVSGSGWDAGGAHAMVDFGDDALTVGRPHPMIDPSLRLEHLARELADPRVGAVLIDVVLGHGSHPDPAAGIASVLLEAADRPGSPAVVVSLTATSGDPQGRTAQAEVLRSAGAHVHLSNAAAARHAAALVAGEAS